MLQSKELRFQRWDYGTNCSVARPFEETCNQQKYGSMRPPEYDLSKITAPQVGWIMWRQHGENDLRAQMEAAGEGGGGLGSAEMSLRQLMYGAGCFTRWVGLKVPPPCPSIIIATINPPPPCSLFGLPCLPALSYLVLCPAAAAPPWCVCVIIMCVSSSQNHCTHHHQVIMSGEMDTMSVTEDVAEQRRRLAPGVLAAEMVYQTYGHMDFVWDRTARHMLDLVDIAYRFSPGTF